MKTENKNRYYNDEDEINFEKLNNFRKFNSNFKNNIQSNNHNIKYANSDKNNFNNILKIDQKVALYNENDNDKEINYYNSSDFQEFNKLKQFTNFSLNKDSKVKNEYLKTVTNYTSEDVNKFDEIIKIKNKNINNSMQNNKKIKIIDFDKLNEKQKKIKNKVDIEKIKVIYFD